MKTYISEYLMNAFTPKKLKTFPPANQCRYYYRMHKILQQMSLRISHCSIMHYGRFSCSSVHFVCRIRWKRRRLETVTQANQCFGGISSHSMCHLKRKAFPFTSHGLPIVLGFASFFSHFSHFQWKQIRRKKLLAEVLSHWINAPTKWISISILPHFDGLFEEKSLKL